MPKKDLQGYVVPLCQRLASEMDYELVDVELVKEGPGRYLRIYLDTPTGITLSDCERFHRAVQPSLEDVDYDFLEVSSPGVDRPLKTDRDFERMLGEYVEVRLYKQLDGQKTLVGTLQGYDDASVRLRADDRNLTIARRDIALIRADTTHMIPADDEDEGEIDG